MYYSSKDQMQLPNKYFDKRVAEEDTPISVSEEVQDRYQSLDAVYEDFFDDNSLHLAKVIFF